MEKNMYTVADLAKLMNRDKFEVRKAVRFLFDDMEADFGYMLTEEECDQVSRYFANTPTPGTIKGTIHFDVKVEVPDVEGLRPTRSMWQSCMLCMPRQHGPPASCLWPRRCLRDAWTSCIGECKQA